MDIDYIIEYEGEGTNFDFKRTEYIKNNYYELLKDVIAMANARTDGDKYIITGVKKYPNGEFEIHALSSLTDAAIYQKLILDNIEPDIQLDYLPHLYKGKDLVGIIKIMATHDKPYMMKKRYGNDKQVRNIGESFIRKGTATFPLMRKDIDFIFENRKNVDAFSHTVSFYFTGDQKSKVLEIKPITIKKLPSDIERDEIQAVIDKKEQAEKDRLEKEQKLEQERLKIEKKIKEYQDRGESVPLNLTLSNFSLGNIFHKNVRISSIPSIYSRPLSYDEMDLETLYKKLKKVKKTYYEDDLYALLNKHASKINITALNTGSKYLEDAVVQIEIPNLKGLKIADKIYKKPVKEIVRTGIGYIPEFDYPTYTLTNETYIYKEHIGNLRHLQPQDVFSRPIRLSINSILSGAEIEIKITLYGKNLPSPIKDALLIKIVE